MNCSSDWRGEGSGKDEPRSNLLRKACTQVDKAERVRGKVLAIAAFIRNVLQKNGKQTEQKEHLINGKVNAFVVMAFFKVSFLTIKANIIAVTNPQ